MKKRKIKIAPFVCLPLLFIGVLAWFSATWYCSVFTNVGFDSILYSFLTDLAGTEQGMLFNFLIHAAIPAIAVTIVVGLVFFSSPAKKLMLYFGKKGKVRLYPLPRWLASVLSCVLAAVLFYTAAVKVEMPEYIKYVWQDDTFIEERYVDPKETKILFPEEKQNLIIIHLESMETSFLSEEYGGGNDLNPLSELCALAEENINFSHNDTVGGFSSLSGSGWTIGAMVSQSSGIPLKLPFDLNGNSYGEDNFLPGVTNLFDILHENGYYQALMVGSDASFGGRRQYYSRHRVDQIYDIFTAREDGIVPEDYHVWWGMEDLNLFRYAKEELTLMAQKDEPFALTLLTVDTHHVGGYVCSLCGDEYPEQYENVLRCSSRQVAEFVRWLQEQEFFENTTLVITGDHPTMDADYFTRNIPETYDRKVYNCFINSAKETDHSKNRSFSSLDIFPTILSAMGCTIEGDRLGLGTDLFSQTPTLCEELGIEEVNERLSRRSKFYDEEFLEMF